MSESLRNDLPDFIHVGTIFPGYVDTPLTGQVEGGMNADKFAEIVKQSNVIMEDAVRKQLDLLVQADSPMAAAIAALDISEFEDSIDKLLKLTPNEVPSYLPAGNHYPNKDALIDLIFNKNVTTSSEALRSRGIKVNKPVQGVLLDIKKRIKKRTDRKKPEIDPWDDSPVGSSWDITDPKD